MTQKGPIEPITIEHAGTRIAVIPVERIPERVLYALTHFPRQLSDNIIPVVACAELAQTLAHVAHAVDVMARTTSASPMSVSALGMSSQTRQRIEKIEQLGGPVRDAVRALVEVVISTARSLRPHMRNIEDNNELVTILGRIPRDYRPSKSKRLSRVLRPTMQAKANGGAAACAEPVAAPSEDDLADAEQEAQGPGQGEGKDVA